MSTVSKPRPTGRPREILCLKASCQPLFTAQAGRFPHHREQQTHTRSSAWALWFALLACGFVAVSTAPSPHHDMREDERTILFDPKGVLQRHDRQRRVHGVPGDRDLGLTEADRHGGSSTAERQAVLLAPWMPRKFRIVRCAHPSHHGCFCFSRFDMMDFFLPSTQYLDLCNNNATMFISIHLSLFFCQLYHTPLTF